jgi:hypothetical protein
VLPGTIHPETKRPYEWQLGLLGDWRELPAIPPKLLAIWRELAQPIDTAPDLKAVSKPKESLEALRKLLKGKPNNDLEYDEWLKVGMALHDATGGAREGIELWDEWSRTSKKYGGMAYLLQKYRSFSSAGKNAVTVGSLKKDVVAAVEDFEPVPPEEQGTPADPEVPGKRKAKRAAAAQALEEKLIYVANSESYFDMTRHNLIGMSALEHLFTPTMPISGKAPLNPVLVLKCSKTKTVVDALGFHPGEGVIFKFGDDVFANRYRNRLPKPIEPMKDELDRIEWIFNLIDDDMYRTWLKQFYGHVIQHPGVKINAAPLIWSSTTGNGKNTIVKNIPALLVGSEYSVDVDCDLLSSAFTDYLQGAWHVYLGEFRAGSKADRTAITMKLKKWITDSTVPVQPKGKAAYTMPNHFFVTASSNEEDAAAIDNNDRRWAVHEFKAPQMSMRDAKWIYDDFLKGDRAAAVLRHYFLSVDLTGFDPAAKAPETDARQAMIDSSTPGDIQHLVGMWERREGVFAKDVIMTHELFEAVQRQPWGKWLTLQRLGILLTRAPFNGEAHRYRNGDARFRAVVLRNNDKWRTASGKQIFDYLDGSTEISVDDDPLLS